MCEEGVSFALKSQGFTLIEKIGTGGYSDVYSVTWDRYPENLFVAKVITLEEGSQREADSYIKEITALKSIYHKNIIKIYKHFVIQPYMIIIMEFCKNGTLSDYVQKNGPLTCPQFKFVARQCLEAIEFCHKNGIAHRDLKPTNILLDENFNIRLCDFGISEKSCRFITRKDGTAHFVPPELIKGIPYSPEIADIWALGITFYVFISGNMPWECKTRGSLQNEIMTKDLLFPSNVNPEIQKLICNMIRKDPNYRFTAEKLLKSEILTHCSETFFPNKIRKAYSNLPFAATPTVMSKIQFPLTGAHKAVTAYIIRPKIVKNT